MENEVYSGHYMKVTEELIGSDVYERVYVRGAVILFPITENGKILFIREFRPHETPNVRLKPVTGFIDPGQSWQETCQNELQEEVGFKADSLELIHHLSHVGSVNVDKYFVLAKGLSESRLPNPDGEDVIQEVLEFSLEECIEKTLNQEIPILFDTLGIFLLYHKVKKGELCI